MTDYIINYTDPLKRSFIIKPYTSNGPRFPTTSTRPSTSAVVNSPLLLYGKGHPNYGERTDENLLHLAENFSGPSAPIIDAAGNTIPGIVWHAEVLYRYDSGNLYEWQGNDWVDVSSRLTGSEQNGHFRFTGSPAVLQRYSDDEREIQSWIDVEYDTEPVNSPATPPTRELRVNHDGTSWVVVPDLDTTDSTYLRLDGTNTPTADIGFGNFDIINVGHIEATDGAEATPTYTFSSDTDTGIYLDTGNLRFTTGGTWKVQVESNGTLSVNNPTYESLVTSDDDIPNKKYVDVAVAGAAGADTFLVSGTFSTDTLTLNYNGSPALSSFNVTGFTFTADQITFSAGSPLPAGSPLTINIGSVATTEVQTALNELETQKASLTEDETFTGDIDFTGVVTFNGTVIGPSPSISSELATKGYVDTQVSGAGPAERYIITGTTSRFLFPNFPNFVYGTEEYRLMVFKNGVKLYANDNTSSPITEYGYYEIYLDSGSPATGSPGTLGSPLPITYPPGASFANGIELTTPPLVSDVFEILLI